MGGSTVCEFYFITYIHCNSSSNNVYIPHNQVKSCDRCQRGNKKLKKAAGGLHPIPVKLQAFCQAFCQLGMDLIGPLPETPRGNRFIVTLTDYFSKWAEAVPLPSKHAGGIAKFIYSVSTCKHLRLLYN